ERAGVPRARMYVAADLPWLRGFPLGQDETSVTWAYSLPGGSANLTQVQLSRAQLRRAQLTFNRLVHQFPRALPRVVGNVAAWSARVDRLLGQLKAAVHGGAPLPASLFDIPAARYPAKIIRSTGALRRRHPALVPLIGAFSWRLAFDPG